jgi:hypothetical protein
VAVMCSNQLFTRARLDRSSSAPATVLPSAPTKLMAASCHHWRLKATVSGFPGSVAEAVHVPHRIRLGSPTVARRP